MSNSILIIDDDPDILRVLKANLEFNGFNVNTSESWREGEETLSAGGIDLLILDVMLPDGNGFDICRAVRKVHHALPIVMLTAKDKISDKVIGLEGGADDYVVKPFETLELIARIKAILRRSRPSADEDSIEIGGLEINYKKRSVKKQGREVALTPKEYELLRFLVSRRGGVVSREDIKRLLWKEDKIYSWSRVIDVHIQHLRQKIEEDPSDPGFIVTIPGVGYRFRE